MLAAFMGEWRKWREAIRGLSQNPIAEYFTLTEQRRRKRSRMPLWARILTLIAVILLIALGYWLVGTVLLGNFPAASLGAGEIARILINISLAVVTTLAGITILRRLFSTCLDAFSVLGRDPGTGKSRRLLLDDMTATTTLTDHDIAAGVLSILVPRLMFLAVGAGTILWLWLVVLDLQWGFSAGTGEALQLLVTGPLLVGGITAIGVLASVATLAWLMVLGCGVVNRIYASAAALMITIGHLILVPISFALGAFRLEIQQSSYGRELLMICLGQLIAAFLFPALMYLLLMVSLKRPGRLAALGWLVPLSFPVIGAFTLIIFFQGPSEEVQMLAFMGYLQGWVSTAVCNLSAIPAGICLPSLVSEGSSGNLMVEITYWLQLLQVSLMAIVGLWMLRRAVHQRRQDLT